MSRNDVIASELGMSSSTARSRLVKMLLFRELQRSNNDNCFKCGDKIEDIDHLSIEHKRPWLHISADLYWDLDNIEFSHLTCNRPHTIRQGMGASGGEHGKSGFYTRGNGCRCDLCTMEHKQRLNNWRRQTGRRSKAVLVSMASTSPL